MKYAVVKIGGTQYKVGEGEELTVDRLPQKEEEIVNFPEVFLLVDDGQVKIGQPIISGVAVDAKVVSHLKGEKIRVARFKAKSRYRRVKGFRAALTKIRIEKIATTEAQKSVETLKLKKKTGKAPIKRTTLRKRVAANSPKA